mgnify:CR=1 FL=1
MKIGARLAIQVSIFVFIATGIILLLVNFQLKRFAVEIAEDKARFFLEEKQATIDYVVEHLRPPLFKLIKEKGLPESYFEPSWMSAGYINRNIMHYMYKTEFADFYYKNAAINSRSPENEADPIERTFLEEAQKNPKILRRAEVAELDGKPYFIYMRTNTSRFQEVCLRCHSTPERAPADLVKLYGKERSFGKKIGDIVSVLSVRVPLEMIYSSIDALTGKLFLIICGFAGFFFTVQFLMTKRNIVSPLNHITHQVNEITKNDTLLGEPIFTTGRDELKELAEAFSNLSKRLSVNQGHLNNLVKERTRELEDARREYRDLFDKMLDGFALHEMCFDEFGSPTDYVFLKVNPAFEKITGLKADRIIGERVLNILPGTEPYWLEKYGEVVLKGRPVQFEHYSGQLDKFFTISAFRAKGNQFACVFRDITELKRTEKAVKDREAFQRALIQSISVPIFYKDANGRYLGFNNAFEDFFGTNREELVGKTVFDINPAELAEKYHTMDTELIREGGFQQYEHQVKTSKGELRDVIFNKSTFTDSNGKVQGLIGTILDITERKKNELEKEKMISELRDALKQVKTLRGLLPICAHCKKIRDDNGYWNQLESYLVKHSEAEFSHGICKECAEKYYPDMDIYEE